MSVDIRSINPKKLENASSVRKIVVTLGDAAIASFVPVDDSQVIYNVPVLTEGRTFTFVDADIETAAGSPPLGTAFTFTILNNDDASAITLSASGGSTQAAAGAGLSTTIAAGAARRYVLHKASATYPKWQVNDIA